MYKPLVWTRGRAWWWRIPIFAWFVILLKDNLQKLDYAMRRLSNPFSALDFGMHELGHKLFSPFGQFLQIVGGSIFQCVFPLLWMVGFLQKKWYFAASMCWCWLGLNLFDVATYAADARARTLPLSVGLGVFGADSANTDAMYDQAHDWYQMLSRTNHLSADLAIAHGLRIAAVVSFLIGFVTGGVLLLQMIMCSINKLSAKHKVTE